MSALKNMAAAKAAQDAEFDRRVKTSKPEFRARVAREVEREKAKLIKDKTLNDTILELMELMADHDTRPAHVINQANDIHIFDYINLAPTPRPDPALMEVYNRMREMATRITIQRPIVLTTRLPDRFIPYLIDTSGSM